MDERPRSGFNDFDYNIEQAYDDGFDDEGTMDEEEMLSTDEDDVNELQLLEDDANLSLEELRERYYGRLEVDAQSVSEQSSSGDETTVAEDEVSSASDDRADIGSPAAAHHTNYFSEDDDEEYLPPDPYRKQIRIGPFFQAVIPGFANVVEEGESEDYEELLWSPHNFPEEEVESYLRRYHEMDSNSCSSTRGTDNTRSLPTTSQPYLRDDENALKGLLDANYNTSDAFSHFPFPSANAPRITAHGHSTRWNLRLPHRTVGELIHFYYIWKKTERHDMFEERIKGVQGNPNCINQNRMGSIFGLKYLVFSDHMGSLIDHFGHVAGDATSILSSSVRVISSVAHDNLNVSLSKERINGW
ncbi:unnamed protein product [Dracunculus medinensis]|uniref:ELM2 domain-containing protein n=1 Tax=Dracunculus medinensis TaxID=318479 RepID=A0A0N4UIC3_DRAME|nr:unnamed protein product [Dracunculus medinensis]